MNAHCESISTPSVVRNGSNLAERLINGIKSTLKRRKQHRIDRDAFAHLLKLDDSTLLDIGVTRADVEWASRLPLSEDASIALELASRGHRKRS